MRDAPSIAATEIDPERIIATLERSLAERPLLLMRPDAAISLGAYALARASGFGEDEEPAFALDGEIATLSISGPLYQRAVTMCGWTLADGYDAIAERARSAFSSPLVGAVLMEIDSPGGDAAGVLELSDALASMAAESAKPLFSYGNESAASAAYWLATSAEEIVVPRAGELGSIGAIVMGLNRSAALAGLGLRPIVAAYPSGKSAGWDAMLAPPDSAEALVGRERMQARAEEIARLFAADVARRRGKTTDEMLALDGAMLGGERAVASGLADYVGSLAMAKDRLRAKVKRKGYAMSTNPVGASATAAVEPAEARAQSAETERLTALGRALEALTGQQGPAALEVAMAWRDGAARVPGLERRVKVEALQGRLSNVYPPAERFALAPALGADGKPHPRAGLPDPSAGPHERFDQMSIAVFDSRTTTGTVHPAIAMAPAPALTGEAALEARAKAAGMSVEVYRQAAANIGMVI